MTTRAGAEIDSIRAWLALSFERRASSARSLTRTSARGRTSTVLEFADSPEPGFVTLATLGLTIDSRIEHPTAVELVTYGPPSCGLERVMFVLQEWALDRGVAPLGGGVLAAFRDSACFAPRFPNAAFSAPFPWRSTYEPPVAPFAAHAVYVAALDDAEFEMARRQGLDRVLARGSVSLGDPRRPSLVGPGGDPTDESRR